MQLSLAGIVRTLLLLVLALVVLGAFVQSGIDGYARASFSDQIHGTAHKPFVARALAPAVVRAICSCIPPTARQWVSDTVRQNLERTEREKWLNYGEIDATEFIVAMAVIYVSIIGFALLVPALARTFYEITPLCADMLSITAVAGLPCFFAWYAYVYDLPHLLLFTGCLVLLARKQMLPYLLLFVPTTVGKETSVLLILVFMLTYDRPLTSRKGLAWLAVQGFIFLVVRLSIMLYFMDNPGGIVEIHLRHNLSLRPYSFGQFVAFLAIGLSIASRWPEKPRFLRRSLWIACPLLVLTFFFGYIDEYRDYYEVYPVVLLLCAHTLVRIVRPTGLRAR